MRQRWNDAWLLYFAAGGMAVVAVLQIVKAILIARGEL